VSEVSSSSTKKESFPEQVSESSLRRLRPPAQAPSISKMSQWVRYLSARGYHQLSPIFADGQTVQNGKKATTLLYWLGMDMADKGWVATRCAPTLIHPARFYLCCASRLVTHLSTLLTQLYGSTLHDLGVPQSDRNVPLDGQGNNLPHILFGIDIIRKLVKRV